jgi:PmbA protein
MNSKHDVSAVDDLDIESEIQQLETIASKLIKMATAKGATQAEVGFSKSLGLSVKVRDRDIETLEFNRDNGLGLTVYFGDKKGSASSTDLSEKGLEYAVEAACNIAKYTQEDPYSGLIDASFLAKEAIDLELDHPCGLTAEQAKTIALECEQAGLSQQGIYQSEGASFNCHRGIRYLANSHGFSAAVPSTRQSLSCVLIAKDEQGMQRDYDYSVSRDFNQLESPETIGLSAAKKVVQRLGAKSIKTQKAPVLMMPDMARGLVGHFCSAIRGGSLYRKSSFLLDSLNQRVFPEFVSFNEKPFIKGGLASAWFDSDGMQTREQAIVEQGEVKTYLLDSYSARRLELQPTGHAGGLHNLQVQTGELGFDDLVKKMQRGLIVTDVMGQGVNLVTGDYSRGASGFWVESGEVQHFVEEITIASNLKDMFANLVAIGNDVDKRSSNLTGSWLLDEMTIAAS